MPSDFGVRIDSTLLDGPAQRAYDKSFMEAKSKPGRRGAKSDQSGRQMGLAPIAAALGTVKREGLTEKLVEKLERLILQGVLQAGDRLPPERDLAEILGVSRASLRGALKAFQVMGVLEVRQGSGNYLSAEATQILEQPARTLVPLPNLSQAELFEVRRAMEGEAAASAALRATEADLRKIRAEYSRLAKSTTNTVIFSKHDLAFHHAIALASGNRYFVWFLSLANKVLYEALLQRPYRGDLKASLGEHQRILAAIEKRDPDAARREMLAHVSLAKYYMLEEHDVTQIRFVAYETNSKQPRELVQTP
jgi:GntR family transcriptional regulator, transcriptional repressor for pyruvate dehydrogenase complex